MTKETVRQVWANIHSYIIAGGNHKSSKKTTVYTNPFFKIPTDLLPPFSIDVYNLVKDRKFEVGEPVAYITNLSRFKDEKLIRTFSIRWMTEGIDGVLRYFNEGNLNLKVFFQSLPFSDDDLDYSILEQILKRKCNDFDLHKLLERAKWQTTLSFGLQRNLQIPGKTTENSIEGASFRYEFNSAGHFEKIAEPHAYLVEDICQEDASYPKRKPRGWSSKESGKFCEDYGLLVEKYFPDLGIDEETLTTKTLEQITKTTLPRLIDAGKELVNQK